MRVKVIAKRFLSYHGELYKRGSTIDIDAEIARELLSYQNPPIVIIADNGDNIAKNGDKSAENGDENGDNGGKSRVCHSINH